MSSQNTKIENNLKNEQNFENVDKNDQNLDKNEQNFENVDKNDQNLVKNEQNSEKPDKENEKINECLETAIKTLHSTIKKEILDEKLSKLLETSTSNPENNKKLPNFPFSLLPKKIKIENLEKDISIINKLVDSVSRDFEFLRDELREVIKEDSFVERLFGIYSDTFEMDLMRGHPAININRADFFFDEKAQSYFLVEINTISCGYSGISAHMVDFHADLLRENFSETVKFKSMPKHSIKAVSDLLLLGLGEILTKELPKDVWFDKECEEISKKKRKRENNKNGFLERFLDKKKKDFYSQICNGHSVLMIVRENEETGMLDHDIIENQLKKRNVKFIKMTLKQVFEECSLKDSTLNLKHNARDIQIDVVYFRAGYSPQDYPSEKEWKARKMIETSNCLKAPTVGYQLAGCKRLQQAFSRPGVLSKYLNAAEADILAKYFNESHNFEGENKAQIIDKILADPVEWLLKPQREGGGNIIEGENMCKILREDKELKGLIAMKKIWPVESSTVFSKNGVIFGARSVSEVGVFGTFLRIGDRVLNNKFDGWLLRTKPKESVEGGVSSGSGVIDSFVVGSSDV